MQITVTIPDRLSHKDIHIASTETDRKALKSRLEKTWRKYLRRYTPLIIPIRCGFCVHVGEAQWHCHNRDSTQYGINVHDFDVCSKWSPNLGLLIMLWNCWYAQTSKKAKTMKWFPGVLFLRKNTSPKRKTVKN